MDGRSKLYIFGLVLTLTGCSLAPAVQGATSIDIGKGNRPTVVDDVFAARAAVGILANDNGITSDYLPPPVLGKTVNVAPVSGTVLVAVPAGANAARRSQAAQKGPTFVPLKEARQVPVGTFFNTRGGRLRLQTAAARPGKRQAGEFFGGLFQALQSRQRSAKGLTELRLKGSSFERCSAPGKQASVASTRKIRRLRGSAKGRFRTRGRFSSATVRGTVWGVIDRCDGTLTRVTRGMVAVRDFRRRKTILVRGGKTYLVRAPR